MHFKFVYIFTLKALTYTLEKCIIISEKNERSETNG